MLAPGRWLGVGFMGLGVGFVGTNLDYLEINIFQFHHLSGFIVFINPYVSRRKIQEIFQEAVSNYDKTKSWCPINFAGELIRITDISEDDMKRVFMKLFPPNCVEWFE